ncbi:MAG TPA: TlpA disulfide reductase family protein [Drouetiella sp.]
MRFNSEIKIGTLALLLCVLQLFCGPGASSKETQPESVPPPGQNIDQATKLLKESLEFYRHCGAWSFNLMTDVSLFRDGKTNRKVDEAKCDFVRAKYLRVQMLQPKKRGIVAVEGTDAKIYCPKWRSFTESKLGSLEEVFADPDFNFVTDGDLGWSLLPQLTSPDPLTGFLQHRAVKSYDGIVDCNGRKCHQITLTDTKNGANQHLWVARGLKPWIVRFEPVSNTEMHGMPATQDGKPSLLTMTVSFSDAKVGSKIGPFKLPSQSRKVSHFTIESRDDVRQELVGRAAPGFSVRTAGGGNFNLKRERKKIVVMEFWATWCAPCVRALPVLDEVSRNFSDKNVEFIAMNLKEEEKRVCEFLADKALSVRVGIDTTGKVANLYHVSGVPQTVIIGRDGVVKAVYVGAGSEIKEQVSKVLQDSVIDSVH